MKAGAFALSLGLLSVLLAGTAPIKTATAKDDWRRPAGKDWPVQGGDWSNSRYSTLSQITAANAKTLGGAWVKKFEGESSRATPLVLGGRMFVTTSKTIYALNPATGETLWSMQPQGGVHGSYKGPAIGDGMLFVGLANGHVVALKQETGQQVWEGAVSDTPPQRGQFIAAGPTYVNGLVISGLANGDYGIRGRVVALDAKTGKEVWRFNSVPGPGEPGHETWQSDNEEWKQGGGGVWMNIATDPDLGLAYFGVGNPLPQWGGELRRGDNLYTDSAVALDLKTGKVRWHYQITHHDIWEADVGTPLVLYDATVDGRTRKGIAVVSTYGWMFLLDRATGKPIFPVEERPVPQAPRLFTHPTQPVPVGADQIGPDCVPQELIPAGFRALCHYDPVDFTLPNGFYPILSTRAAPMAYSPDTKLFYATAGVWPYWMKRMEDPKFFNSQGLGVPGIKSYGLIVGLDSRTNKIAWQKKTPYSLQNGSGVTATAGGVLFHGDPDGALMALDAKTGDELWRFQTGGRADGAAAIFETAGSQHVALTTSNALWAFRLGGTVAPLPAPTPPPTETSFSGRVEATNMITLAPTVSDTGLEKIRTAHDEFGVKPQRARVKAGSAVTFTNSGTEKHTATAVDGSWTTGEIAPGQSVNLFFNKPGTYTYICRDHPWTYAQLVVE